MNSSTSEDCLYLNIWAPACGSRPCGGNRTVVVFIHGGFFQGKDKLHESEVAVAIICDMTSPSLFREFENGPFLELRVRAESDTHIVQTGSNNDPHYDGRALAALGDVVVVVPNWRLGVLGFFSLSQSDEVPINVGLLDQAESLRWTARKRGRLWRQQVRHGGRRSRLRRLGSRLPSDVGPGS
ncbi:hypothetical protein HPB50_028649 [Hyalomma asiaticum]|nr:hypothetical protein HPB50_028649 [Hyalomma asiaticum]